MPAFTLLALLAGAMLPLQAAINSRLGRALGGPVWAATVSGVVLTAALAAVGLAFSRLSSKEADLHGLPWCGAFVLAASTAVTPRLGAATMIALVVTGQVLCSLSLDRFGLLGLTPHPLTLRRVGAAILLIAGAALIGSEKRL